MISESAAANPLLSEALLQLVQKCLDDLSQKEHQMLFRMAQLMKNGFDQTCAVNEFTYSAPYGIKICRRNIFEQCMISHIHKDKINDSYLRDVAEAQDKNHHLGLFLIYSSFFLILLKKPKKTKKKVH